MRLIVRRQNMRNVWISYPCQFCLYGYLCRRIPRDWYLLGDAARKRMAEGNEETLDLFIAANWISPDQAVRKYMLERAENDAQRQFMQQKVGLIQTLPYRGGYPPTAEMLAEDPIAVAATDYPELPVDQEAFRGPVPEGVPFLMLDRMTARLNCKLWTANVRGAMTASFAKKKGYTYVKEANEDAQVQQWAALGHQEAIFGALIHFGFTEEELHKGMRKEDPKAAKRTTSDTLNRQLNNLKRKLGRNDRLVGPALACLEGGRIPFFLSRAIAYAILILITRKIRMRRRSWHSCRSRGSLRQ